MEQVRDACVDLVALATQDAEREALRLAGVADVVSREVRTYRPREERDGALAMPLIECDALDPRASEKVVVVVARSRG